MSVPQELPAMRVSVSRKLQFSASTTGDVDHESAVYRIANLQTELKVTRCSLHNSELLQKKLFELCVKHRLFTELTEIYQDVRDREKCDRAIRDREITDLLL